jgi:hypothetical protein
MKIYIKNMVCQGTRFYVLNELRNLGFKYNKFEFGELDLQEDLSLPEIQELDNSLRKFGLEFTFDKNTPAHFKYS